MGKILTALFFVAAILVAVVACNTSGCLENQNSVPLAGFYSYASGKSISVDSLEIGGVGAPNDSLLCDVSQTLSSLYLPFRAMHSSTSFYIHYAQRGLDYPELNDTLTFDYDSQPYFASEECGAMYHYRITRFTYTRHLIDSVGISDSLINNVDIERIRIYFRTSDEQP